MKTSPRAEVKHKFLRNLISLSNFLTYYMFLIVIFLIFFTKIIFEKLIVYISLKYKRVSISEMALSILDQRIWLDVPDEMEFITF